MLRQMSSEEWENAVRVYRRLLGLEYVSYLDPMTVITKLKAQGHGFNYERIPQHRMTSCEAQYDSFSNILRIREDVFSGMQYPNVNNRSRFTFFHEILHLLLGHQGIRNRSFVKNIAEEANRKVAAEERHANRATAIFMAPSYLIDSNDSVGSIERRFGLSRSAAEIRKEEIDRLHRIRTGRLRELPPGIAEAIRDLKTKNDHRR